MTQKFKFSKEHKSEMPGVIIHETFTGEVQLPDYTNFEDEEPILLWLFRDGVECRTPPISVSKAEWYNFEQRCFQAARDAYQAKSENKPTHNGGFVPSALDTKYLQDRGDRFPDVQIDRS